MWNKRLIKKHVETARILERIKIEAFDFISENPDVSEHSVQELIHRRFKENKLITTDPQIVAFGKSTGEVHYFPDKKFSRKLKRGDLILMDIWARFREKNCPYADLTYMGSFGKINKSQKKLFDTVFSARDKSIMYVKNSLKKGIFPVGRDIDKVARDYIESCGYKKKFLHSLGHGLGFSSPHWRGRNLSPKNKFPIMKKIGYTIEPGAYLKGWYGVRSEMDFYIDDKLNFVESVSVQKKIIKV